MALSSTPPLIRLVVEAEEVARLRPLQVRQNRLPVPPAPPRLPRLSLNGIDAKMVVVRLVDSRRVHF